MNYCTFDGRDHSKTPPTGALRLHFPASLPAKSGGEKSMARKKKAKRFRAVTAVKELARERVGEPPAGQIVVEKKKKPEKHKPTLRDLLTEGE
jgi:hypothetical protein